MTFLNFNIVFRLNYQAKSSVRQERIQNRFNTPKPDLKESRCPLENPPNFSRNRRLFAEDISEVTSSTKTSVSSQTPSSVTTIQDDTPTQGDFIHHGFESERKLRSKKDETRESASSGKERDKFVLGWNRKYIVSPFRMQRGSFNLAKSKSVTEDGKSLSHIKESYEDKSSEPTDVKDRDLGSNTAVRWRITIKRQQANATLEHAVPEVRLKTSLSEKICECFCVKNYRKKRTNRINRINSFFSEGKVIYLLVRNVVLASFVTRTQWDTYPLKVKAINKSLKQSKHTKRHFVFTSKYFFPQAKSSGRENTPMRTTAVSTCIYTFSHLWTLLR